MPQSIPNFDTETQIHYGVIAFNSVSPDALTDVYDNGENLTYNEAVADVKAGLRRALRDVFSDYRYNGKPSELDEAVDAAWEAVADGFNDHYEGSDEQYLYKADGYEISNSPSLCALFVTKSPYYTYCRQCSPCAPNAGDLDNANGSLKTYCLGHEWFDGDAPYPVYSVATDSREIAPSIQYSVSEEESK